MTVCGQRAERQAEGRMGRSFCVRRQLDDAHPRGAFTGQAAAPARSRKANGGPGVFLSLVADEGGW